MGIGSSIGEGRAANAARAAITSPLLEASIEGARGMVLNIAGGSDLGLFEVNEAAEIIHGVAHPDANIIFGAVIDDNMGDEVRVTVIAAGFERWEEGAGRPPRPATWPRRSSRRPSRWTSSPTPPGRRRSSTWETTISTSPPSSASDEVARRLHGGPGADRARRRRPRPGAGGRRHQGVRPRGGARPRGRPGCATWARTTPPSSSAKAAADVGGRRRWSGTSSAPCSATRSPQLAPLVGLWQSVAREAEGERIARFAPGAAGPGAGRDDGPARPQRVPARGRGRAGRRGCATSGSTCGAS